MHGIIVALNASSSDTRHRRVTDGVGFERVTQHDESILDWPDTVYRDSDLELGRVVFR